MWKSKGLSDESIKPSSTSDNSLAPALKYFGNKSRVTFYASCLQQDKITFTHRKIVNIYSVYEINFWDRGHDDYLGLANSLFGTVKLVKNADIDKYKYYGYGIGFDRCGTFSVGSGFSKNVIIFGADMSSSVHVDNKKKYILILGEGPKLGLDDTTLNAKNKCSINFTESRKKFCLSLDYNEANSYLFVNGTEIHKFKANESEIMQFHYV